MTVNVVRRRPRTRQPAAATGQLNIGEIEQTIFACPACARPLALGSGKCPACGTRLVMGVQLRRASIFTAAGLFAGLLLGAGGVAGMSTIDRLGRDAAAASQAAAADTGTTLPTADPSSPGASASSRAATPGPTPRSTLTAGVPALSRSALGQAVALNGRLRDSGAALGVALAAKSFDAFEVSQVLRTMSSDAVVGLGLTSHIGAWSGGRAVASELTAFYTGIQAAAAEGLAASIRNEPAYRAAATQMVKRLAELEAIDLAVRDSLEAGITLPMASAAP